MRIREQLAHFGKATGSRRRAIANQISKTFIAKIERIENNWPDANLHDLKQVANGIKNNADYLDQIIVTPQLILLKKSHLEIALERCKKGSEIELTCERYGACRGMRGENKILIKNPYQKSWKFQVWSNWEENKDSIGKHLGKPTKDASVWDKDIDRIAVQEQAISEGRAKFFNRKRIDFVFENESDVGTLNKKLRIRSRFVRVELVRMEPENKKRKSSFHGFPISESEFSDF